MRRKRHEEHLNHEAWAIPYADLMTLLLAFFVVMYAVSVVNVGKYRVMSQSMMDAFNGHQGAAVPLPQVKISQTVAPLAPAAIALPAVIKLPLPPPMHVSIAAATAAEQQPKPDTLVSIEDLVRKAMQPLIDKKLVVLRRTPDRLEIEIRTDILFTSGEAKLSSSADLALVKVASILSGFSNALRVEGFTDNIPISTPVYPSNWELSAARAASVARLFAGHGVVPGRLGIVGWGDVRPIADNDTQSGRNQNRRVLVVVEGEQSGDNRSQGDMDPTDLSPALSELAAHQPTSLPTNVANAPPAGIPSPAVAQVTLRPGSARLQQYGPGPAAEQSADSHGGGHQAGGAERAMSAGRNP